MRYGDSLEADSVLKGMGPALGSIGGCYGYMCIPVALKSLYDLGFDLDLDLKGEPPGFYPDFDRSRDSL